MVDGVLLGPAINRTLLAVKDAQSVVDRVTLRLSTNKDVNSALDDPDNYFTSDSLSNRSLDLLRLLDGIDRNISTIKEALYGIESLQTLLEQAETIALESQRLLDLGITDPDIYEHEVDTTLSPLYRQILNDNPDGYWRLNDAGGPAVNLGASGAAINGNYTGGVTLGAAGLYENVSDVSADFDGNNDRVRIPNSGLINVGNQPRRTVELVFNADDVSAGAGRQVLWEEGGNVNSLNIYIDNGQIYFNARDQNDFGPFAITAPIVAGETYHAAIVFDFTGSGTVTGYLNGEAVGSGVVTRALSSHTGAVAIGSLDGSSYMHDGASPNNTYRFDGRISDVALYNEALGDTDIQRHYDSMFFTNIIEYRHRQYEEVLTQIDNLINDASFRGQNLLDGSSIETFFNEIRSSSLVTNGIDLTHEGLSLVRNDFNDAENLEDVIQSVRDALITVRNYGSNLVNDLLIIETRSEFVNNLTNTLQEGSDKLILADMNKEGAAMLAAQTRLNLAFTSLNLANIFNTSILRLFG